MENIGNNEPCYIRKMKDGDISQVLEIDLDAFPTQWPHPTVNSFHHELRNKLAHYIVICQGCTAQTQNNGKRPIGIKEVISYVVHLFDHDRFFGPEPYISTKEQLIGMAGIWMMVDEAHVVTIAVKKSHRNRGMGEWLLISIIEMAAQLKAKTVTLEVRVSNTVAQTLYSKYGFITAGIRKKYYSDNAEDALIMSTSDLSLPSFQSRFQQLKEEHRKHWGDLYACVEKN